MTYDELIMNYPVLYHSIRVEVERELSTAQMVRCCCGKLATGLHESSCKKFNDKVNKETYKRTKEALNRSNTSI